MVSRKEVAAAIQAAAESCGVTPEELGRLSAFLLEMPKKHLDFAPIGADKAVVAFVRARYQGMIFRVVSSPDFAFFPLGRKK